MATLLIALFAFAAWRAGRRGTFQTQKEAIDGQKARPRNRR